MATFNIAIRYAGSIKQGSTSPITFTVPANTFFKGTISAEWTNIPVNIDGLIILGVRLHENNSSGAIVHADSLASGVYNSYAAQGRISKSSQVELPAGTYYLTGFYGTDLTSSTASGVPDRLGIVGALYENTL